MIYTDTIFAQVYNGGKYDTSTYQSGTTGSTSGGILTNTGFDLLLAASLACAIIFATLLVRFWRKPHNKAITLPINTDRKP